MKGYKELILHEKQKPNVLLLGNGILKLASSPSWSELLGSIGKYPVEQSTLDKIPYAMQPEVRCGTNIEAIRHDIAIKMEQEEPHLSPQLEELLTLDFDCILTTNYTYEVECVYNGGHFAQSDRERTIRTFGNPHKQTNLQFCYEFPRKDKPPVQVWHIHGDAMRHNSLVLSYYSYAKAVAELLNFSAERKNVYAESQHAEKPLQVRAWLDWFLMANVYSVGLAWDFAEMDLWWAMERKSRENAETGTASVYFFDKDEAEARCALLKSMQVQTDVLPVREKEYAAGYERVIKAISKDMKGKRQ